MIVNAMSDDVKNQDKPDKAVLEKNNNLYTDNGVANGSSGYTLVEQVNLFFITSY